MVHKMADLFWKLLISNLIGLPLGCPPHCHNVWSICWVCHLRMCLLTGGPYLVCLFVCWPEFWFMHHIFNGTYQHLSILIAVTTMRVWVEMKVMLVLLFLVGQWVEMLNLRQDSRCCRQSAVDMVGVGKWGKGNKYIWSMRILSITSHTEVDPQCYGFRKKLNKHKNKI